MIFVFRYWRELLIAFLLATVMVMYECGKRSTKVAEQKFNATATELGLVKGVARTRDEINKMMSVHEQELLKKLAAAGGNVSGHSTTTVAVHDTITAKPVYGPINQAEPEKTEIAWNSGDGRFSLHLPDGVFARDQRFAVSTTVFVGPDGKTSVGATEFHEYSPLTGQEIPTAGATVKLGLDVVYQKPAGPGPWHPRLVALAAPVGVGIGGQLNPWRGLILTAGGLYGTQKGLSGVVGLGWRLRLPFLDSTLGISGAVAYGKNGASGQPLGSVELSR